MTYYSDNADVISTTVDGLLTAKAPGSANVYVETPSGVRDVCALTVVPAPDKASFVPASITIGIGQVLDTTELLQLPAGTQTEVTYKVESTAVLTNLGEGTVRGRVAGTTRVRATTHNGVTALLTVKVVNAPGSFTLAKSVETVHEGDEFVISPVLPKNTAAEISYTVDNTDVVTVAADGSAHAVAAGIATIKAASHNGKSASITIRVYKHVDGVSLSAAEASIVHYDTLQLTSTVTPDDVYDASVIWTSSDPEKVSVSETGLLTALNITGSPVTVTATTVDGALQASCLVSVTPVRVAGVSLDKTDTALEKGRSFDINAAVAPDNADDKRISWQSSNPGAVTVDENGTVTAVSDTGEAVITCTSTDGGFTASIKVTATKVHLLSVIPGETSLALISRDETNLTYTAEPADADIASVSWRVSNPAVVSVTQNGCLTALGEGSAVVYATVTDTFGTSFTCETSVTVTPIRVTGIEAEKTNITLRTGKTASLAYAIEPLNADNTKVSWKLGSTGVVTLTETASGAQVKAGSKSGSVTATVTTADGGFTAEYMISVVEALELSAQANLNINTTGNDIIWTLDADNVIGDLAYVISVKRDGAQILSADAYDPARGLVVNAASAGVYELNVTITDEDGETVSAASSVSVSDYLTYSQGGIDYTYVIKNVQGVYGASVKLAQCPDSTLNIKVPETMNGAPVVRIDSEAFMGNTAIKTVSVPYSVKEIGARAFKGCTSLTGITAY